MPSARYQIHFPSENMAGFEQGQAHFTLVDKGTERKIGLHDYAAIYACPGLYEQLFYERLQCTSPATVANLLHQVAAAAEVDPRRLRVLDFGAGNGMVGELLVDKGAARVVGLDIIAEAAQAAARDRPGAYDAYYVADVTRLEPEQREALQSWRFNALTTVAALGFGDVPVAAFREAYNLIADDGWIAFNIQESFLESADQSGFAQLVKRMMYRDYLKLFHLQRYRHRLSVEGHVLYYYAIIARKRRDIDDACVAGLD